MLRVLVPVLAALSLHGVLLAAPALRGVVGIGGKLIFAVGDDSKNSFTWAAIGEKTAFGTLVSFEKDSGTLTLRAEDGSLSELHLAAAVIQELQQQLERPEQRALFLSEEVRQQLAAQGRTEKDVLNEAVECIRKEAQRSDDPADRVFLQEIATSLAAGDLTLIDTHGKPLRYEDFPNWSREKVDRVNLLMKMSPEEVDAVIAGRAKMPPLPQAK